jgi:hypothetical protein
MSLAFTAVFAGCLLAGTVGQAAPVNLLYFPLTNAPGSATTNFPSSTSLGGASVTLGAYNGAGALRDLEGLAGSGVNGTATGVAAMCLTNGDTGNATQSANANGAANSAADLGDATLAFGSITNFVVTMWIKEPIVYSDASGNTLPRLFVLSSSASPGANEDTANSIGVKFQLGNQFEMVINNAAATTGNSYNAPANTATLGTTLASDMLANKWYFVAWVYDGTNIYQFTGTDSAVATLQNQFAAAGLSVNLGNPSTLLVGNRNWKGVRGFFGSIEDFRFYSGVSTNNLNFVESIRKEIAPKLPTITGIYPDGASLLQATNTLVFNAISTSGLNLSNISLVLNNVNVSTSLQFVTNGTAGTSTNVSASYTGLLPQTIYTAVISASDPLVTGSATVNFDTFNPTNFIIKAEEFDFNSGQFIDNPVYTNVAEADSYFGLDSVEGVDTHKGQSTGDNQANAYRADDGSGLQTQTPLAAGELPSPTRFGSGIVPNHMIGNWSSAEWQNYTKTFPAGNYNVYARLTTSSGSTVTFNQVTAGQGTSSQTLANLGAFTYSGSGAFQWVPLRKFGTLAVVNLSGQNTVRATTGGGANADFYMLVPANPNLPTISNVYPDGQFLFEPTNKLVFTVSSAAGINTANVTLTLNGTNVSASLVFSGGPNTWNVSYTGLQLNQTYAAVINVTDNSAASANATLSIDTWNPVLQIEAEDFDFNPAKSIVADLTGFRYIDNPVPTPPLVPATNSYEGQVGDIRIDESGNPQTNKSPIAAGFAGATFSNYRTNDPCATVPVTDSARRQFNAASALDYNVGFLGPGHWEQYTRTWPSGTFNLYARVASGASLGTLYSSWSQVIAGWGTTNQITRHVGSFAIPSAAGYSSYFYTPLIDGFGNYAQLTLGGTNTFRDTHLVFNQTETANGAVFGLNINFYMLVAPRTDLARIDSVYPDGTVLMQGTNTLSFVASSPTYGINTTNIQVTLNGVNVSSNLVFSGSSASWNVSYPGLQPNQGYAAIITITDNNNQTHTTTVNFDTFSPNNFTWEAEDFDFGPENSPAPNYSGLRYIDNPAPTSAPATNSYFGQIGDLGIDESLQFQNILGTYVYRTSDTNQTVFEYVSTEVTSDAPRARYQNAQLRNDNPYIVDYDVNFFTNWIDYTRTFPTGNYVVYARLSAGNGAFNMQCAQVTNGVGTSLQKSNVLGNFIGSGASFTTWQNVPLTNASAGSLTILSLGGVETLQMKGDGKENANFFVLVPVLPTITAASVGGTNIVLSFPTVFGLNYTVSWKNNLTDPTWTQLGNPVQGNGAIESVTDSNIQLSQTHRFYRLAVQ